jgi:hypothetical protein
MERTFLRGLQYVTDTIHSGNIEKTKIKSLLQNDVDVASETNGPKGPTKTHRSFTSHISSYLLMIEAFNFY